MPFNTQYLPIVNAIDQIIMAWKDTADLIAEWKTESMIAEKRRAIRGFKEFFILSYPALKSKHRGAEWEQWFSTVDFESMTSLELQLRFIDYCSVLMKYNIIPLVPKKPIPRGGITIESLEDTEVADE